MVQVKLKVEVQVKVEVKVNDTPLPTAQGWTRGDSLYITAFCSQSRVASPQRWPPALRSLICLSIQLAGSCDFHWIKSSLGGDGFPRDTRGQASLPSLFCHLHSIIDSWTLPAFLKAKSCSRGENDLWHELTNTSEQGKEEKSQKNNACFSSSVFKFNFLIILIAYSLWKHLNSAEKYF